MNQTQGEQIAIFSAKDVGDMIENIRSPKYTLMTPLPAILLNDTPMPPPPGEGATVGDLLRYTIELQAAVQKANNDKQTIKKLLDARVSITRDELQINPTPAEYKTIYAPLDYYFLFIVFLLAIAASICLFQWGKLKKSRDRIVEFESVRSTDANGESATIACDDAGTDKTQLVQRITELTSAQSALGTEPDEVAALPKTAAATEARATSELAKWREKHAPAMVKVALLCGAEGGKKRQTGDFERMFKDAGVELSNNMLSKFRSWLPDEHTDKIGGAPVQN